MQQLSDLSDTGLLGLVAERDQAALRELVERHSAWLLLRLLRRTRDDDLAHEALHDTFVAVWRRPQAFRGEGDVGAWLWGIAIRQLVSRLRKRAQPTPITSHALSALSPTVRSAEDELLVAVEYGAVGDALRSLSPELRQVLQATVIDGLSTREAAHLLGIPQGTVKSRARAAKSRLREQLIQLEAPS
jgi:RNA polymerase sigma factor (sigma-70 family)